MSFPPLERRHRSAEAAAIAETLRRMIRQPEVLRDSWQPFPQNGCAFGFGTPSRPLPIGALLTLWQKGAPFTQSCPDCSGILRMVSFGGLLTVGGGRMVCTRCDADFHQPLSRGLTGVASLIRSALHLTEFVPTTFRFGDAIASDGAGLLGRLGLAPFQLKAQSEIILLSPNGRPKTEGIMKRETNLEDEQTVIDAFVDSVYGDHVELARAAGERLVEQQFSGEWQLGQAVEGGTTLLQYGRVPSSFDESMGTGVEIFEGILPPDRLEKLYEGAALTADELVVWRQAAAEAILSENPDFDAYPAWEILRITHSAGEVAFLSYVAGGYSFSGAWAKYLCGAKTVEECLARTREEGFTDVSDFRLRWRSRI